MMTELDQQAPEVPLAREEDGQEATLWREVLDEGDLEALRQLAESINGTDERELGAGD